MRSGVKVQFLFYFSNLPAVETKFLVYHPETPLLISYMTLYPTSCLTVIGLIGAYTYT